MRPPDPDSITSLKHHGSSMSGKTIGQILHELDIQIDESHIESGKGVYNPQHINKIKIFLKLK